MNILVLDTETTGLVPSQADLLTLYARVVDSNLEFIDDIDLLLKPDDGIYKISPGALAVNKINLIEHDKIATPYRQCKTLFGDFLFKNSNYGKEWLTVLGQNPGFDIAFIKEHLISEAHWAQCVSHRLIDTAVITKYLQLAGRIPITWKAGLQDMCKNMRIPTSGAHTARGDVEATLALFERLLGMAGNLEYLIP